MFGFSKKKILSRIPCFKAVCNLSTPPHQLSRGRQQAGVLQKVGAPASPMERAGSAILGEPSSCSGSAPWALGPHAPESCTSMSVSVTHQRPGSTDRRSKKQGSVRTSWFCLLPSEHSVTMAQHWSGHN